MPIPRTTRDQLLVEARHRCTICAEKCFEIHHIVGQAEGRSDAADNLIVLCPNCHQHRYHRSREFTPDQLRLYKARLKEQNEIERRFLLNLEEIRGQIGTIPLEESEKRLRDELAEVSRQVSEERSPRVSSDVAATSRWLAERELVRGGARRAIEVEWEVKKAEQRRLFEGRKLAAVDDDAVRKASDFPGAYTFVLVLDASPSDDWVEVFRHMYKSSWYNMKRKMHIRGKDITLTVGQTDNLQSHIDFVKMVINETNKFLQQVVLPKADSAFEQQKRAALDQFDAIRSLKNRARGLQL